MSTSRFLPIIVATLFNLSALYVHADGGMPAWANFFKGIGNSDDQPTAIALDKNGGVIVAGYASGASGDYDYATIKYSNAGTALWTNVYARAGASYPNNIDQINALAVDEDGSIYVTGFATGSNGIPDYVTVKYSEDGVAQWTNIFNGSGDGADRAGAIVIGASGSAYVTGYVFSEEGQYDCATIKYSSNGGVLWTNFFNFPGTNFSSFGKSLALDSNENLYVGGNLNDGDQSRFLTIKYTSLGVPLWTNLFKTTETGNADLSSLVVAGDGFAYVAGDVEDFSGGARRVATIKYSPAGATLWTNFFSSGLNLVAMAKNLAVGPEGCVYLSGATLTSFESGTDYATVKYAADGTPIWTNIFNGLGNDFDDPRALAVDPAGNVYVTGSSQGNGSDSSFATIKYASSGAALWTNLYQGVLNSGSGAVALAVDGLGSVYVTGTAYFGGLGGGFATIKYVADTVPLSISLMANFPGPLSCSLSLTGKPNVTYVIQFTTNISSGAWFPLGTNTTGANGVFTMVDSSPTNAQRFYRATSP